MARCTWTNGLALIGAAGLLLAGCSGASQPGELIAEGDVDQGGGRVATADDDAVVSVPVGAVNGTKTIEIRRLDLATVPEGVIANTAIALDPDGTTFDEPIELTLHYRKEDVSNPDSPWLRVVQLMPDGSLGWTRFLAHDRDAQRITVQLAHFSSYAIADLEVAQAAFATSEKQVGQVDVLVLVDDSWSMLEEQQSLADSFPRLVHKLDQAGFDYRVGVISPNLGAGSYSHSIEGCSTVGGLAGKLQSSAREEGCSPPNGSWIESHGDSSNVPDGDVAAAFSCIGKLGFHGCGLEQPLEAVYQALDPEVNPGFVREDATLAVLLITDEDDCSVSDASLFDPANSSLGPLNFRCFEYGMQCDGITDETAAREPGPRNGCKPRTDGFMHPISRYVDRLRQLKPEGKVVVSLIAGPATPVAVGLDNVDQPAAAPSCEVERSSDGLASSRAYPAIRLQAFAGAFGAPRSSFTSVCERDFSSALDQLGDLVLTGHKLSWCLPYDPEDTNTGTSDLEADCLIDAGQLGQLPACTDGGSSPCYRVTKNADCPASGSQLEVANARPEDLGQGQVKVTCLIP